MPSTYLASYLDKEKIQSKEYQKMRKACIDFEKKFNVQLQIEVTYWDNFPTEIKD